MQFLHLPFICSLSSLRRSFNETSFNETDETRSFKDHQTDHESTRYSMIRHSVLEDHRAFDLQNITKKFIFVDHFHGQNDHKMAFELNGKDSVAGKIWLLLHL